MDRFQAYLDLEGLNAIAGKHKAQGKPLANIREVYARCAKTLIGVGDAKGVDRLAGMTLEIVAEQNPYLLKPGDEMRVLIISASRWRIRRSRPSRGLIYTARECAH